MADSYTKAKLIADIASTTSLTKADVERVLDRMTELAYREAGNGFVVPGICKLKVVRKKASRRRNPATGQILLIGERSALKIVPLKRAKNMITPNLDMTVMVLDAPPAPAPTSTAPTPQPPTVTAPPSSPADHHEEGQIVFSCPECGSLLAAPPKMTGQTGECPFCNAKTIIPELSSVTGQGGQPNTPKNTPPPASDFILFVCRACGQEIEAPASMVGMDVECPTCATNLTVPITAPSQPSPEPETPVAETKSTKLNRSSMTIRIDLSDLT